MPVGALLPHRPHRPSRNAAFSARSACSRERATPCLARTCGLLLSGASAAHCAARQQCPCKASHAAAAAAAASMKSNQQALHCRCSLHFSSSASAAGVAGWIDVIPPFIGSEVGHSGRSLLHALRPPVLWHCCAASARRAHLWLSFGADRVHDGTQITPRRSFSALRTHSTHAVPVVTRALPWCRSSTRRRLAE